MDEESLDTPQPTPSPPFNYDYGTFHVAIATAAQMLLHSPVGTVFELVDARDLSAAVCFIGVELSHWALLMCACSWDACIR